MPPIDELTRIEPVHLDRLDALHGRTVHGALNAQRPTGAFLTGAWSRDGRAQVTAMAFSAGSAPGTS